MNKTAAIGRIIAAQANNPHITGTTNWAAYILAAVQEPSAIDCTPVYACTVTPCATCKGTKNIVLEQGAVTKTCPSCSGTGTRVSLLQDAQGGKLVLAVEGDPVGSFSKCMQAMEDRDTLSKKLEGTVSGQITLLNNGLRELGERILEEVEKARHYVRTMPRRMERCGGQQTPYVQVHEVNAQLDDTFAKVKAWAEQVDPLQKPE